MTSKMPRGYVSTMLSNLTQHLKYMFRYIRTNIHKVFVQIPVLNETKLPVTCQIDVYLFKLNSTLNYNSTFASWHTKSTLHVLLLYTFIFKSLPMSEDLIIIHKLNYCSVRMMLMMVLDIKQRKLD